MVTAGAIARCARRVDDRALVPNRKEIRGEWSSFSQLLGTIFRKSATHSGSCLKPDEIWMNRHGALKTASHFSGSCLVLQDTGEVHVRGTRMLDAQ
jgi:hypothetical protein